LIITQEDHRENKHRVFTHMKCHTLMKRLLLIFIICLYAPNVQLADSKYPQDRFKLQYSDGRPTTMGIDWYINNSQNQRNFIREYQKTIKDSLYNDIYFRTETPKKKTSILAYNEISANSCEIIVYDKEDYRCFEYDTTKLGEYFDTDYFLKATVMHEISHYYFYQCIMEMQKMLHAKVNVYYTADLYMFPNQELQYGAKFIEEGFCTYIIQKFNYTPEYVNVRIPVYVSELQDKKLDFDIQYIYASKVIWNFLDMSIGLTGSVKHGLMILLSNRPPNYQEIMKPGQYFDRLKLELIADSI
jgi:hypothetical protein